MPRPPASIYDDGYVCISNWIIEELIYKSVDCDIDNFRGLTREGNHYQHFVCTNNSKNFTWFVYKGTNSTKFVWKIPIQLSQLWTVRFLDVPNLGSTVWDSGKVKYSNKWCRCYLFNNFCEEKHNSTLPSHVLSKSDTKITPYTILRGK